MQSPPTRESESKLTFFRLRYFFAYAGAGALFIQAEELAQLYVTPWNIIGTCIAVGEMISLVLLSLYLPRLIPRWRGLLRKLMFVYLGWLMLGVLKSLLPGAEPGAFGGRLVELLFFYFLYLNLKRFIADHRVWEMVPAGEANLCSFRP